MGVGVGLCMYDVVVKKFTFAVSARVKFTGRYGKCIVTIYG